MFRKLLVNRLFRYAQFVESGSIAGRTGYIAQISAITALNILPNTLKYKDNNKLKGKYWDRKWDDEEYIKKIICHDCKKNKKLHGLMGYRKYTEKC